MPVLHNVTQYSEAYDRLKLGIPTSSNFRKIITSQGKPSKQWREYACVLIAERILQRKIEFYNSSAMERGLIVESEAADWYEFDQNVSVQRIGLITMMIARWDAVPIGSSVNTAYWKSRPRYRTLRSSTGFLGKSVNAFGRSSRVNSTFPNAAGSILSAGMMCFQRLSCGLSPMRSSSRPSTASCRSSTSLSRASWKRSPPGMICQSHKGHWL
jgi:hypothetical protein